MSNSLIASSEARKAARGILSEPELFDSELGYFESGEPYFIRRLKCTFELTRSRVVPPLITLLATALIGILTGISLDSVWRGAYTGVIALFVGLLLSVLFNYVFAAPKNMDDILRGNLKAAKSQLVEERHKAVRAVAVIERHYQSYTEKSQPKSVEFEVSTIIRNSTVLLTDSGDTDDWRDAVAFCLEAKLFVRFYNNDHEGARIRDLRLSIVNEATGKEWPLSLHIIPPTFQKPDAQENEYFQGFVVGGKVLTGYHYFQFYMDVPKNCALSVDKNHYLRVSMEAGQQDTCVIDLIVPWKAARQRAVDVYSRNSEREIICL
jgi:hypothetical protein